MRGRSTLRAALLVVGTAGLLAAVPAAAAAAMPARASSTGTGAGQTLTGHWNGTAWVPAIAASPGSLGTSGSGTSKLFGVASYRGGAWAVGEYLYGGGYFSLIEHQAGAASSGWQQVVSPDPSATGNFLASVTATSATDAWAVGYYHKGSVDQTLIEHWNGTGWQQVASPDPGGPGRNNYLTAVTAVSATDAWAVGDYATGKADRTLIEHWNGTAWHVVTSRDAGTATDSNDLFGVSADARGRVWAVGSYQSAGASLTLIERWNGHSWSVVTSPSPGGPRSYSYLYGVTAGSPFTTWAVGTYFDGRTYVTLIERWDGAAWQQVASPSAAGSADSELYAVSAASAASAWAVGAS